MKQSIYVIFRVYKTDSKKSFKALKHNLGIPSLGKPYLIHNVQVNITFKISEFIIVN